MENLSSTSHEGNLGDGRDRKNRRNSCIGMMGARKEGTAATETTNNNRASNHQRRKTMFGATAPSPPPPPPTAAAPQTNSKKQQIINNASSPSKENTPTKNNSAGGTVTAPAAAAAAAAVAATAAAASQTSSKKPHMSSRKSPAKGKTPIKLDKKTSDYFFKTPKSKKKNNKLDSSISFDTEDDTMDISGMKGYDGSLHAADSSFLNSGSSGSNRSSSSEDDLLNTSTQSDPTELVASSFVQLQGTQRQQRLSFLQEYANNNLAGKDSNVATNNEQAAILQEQQPSAGDTGADVVQRKPLGTVNQNNNNNNNKNRHSFPLPATRPLESTGGALAKQVSEDGGGNNNIIMCRGSLGAPAVASNSISSSQKMKDANTPSTTVSKNMRMLSASLRQRRLEKDRRHSAGGSTAAKKNLDISNLLPVQAHSQSQQQRLPPSLSHCKGQVPVPSEEHTSTIQKSSSESVGEEEKARLSTNNNSSSMPNQNNTIDNSIASKVLDTSKRSLGELFDNGTEPTETNNNDNNNNIDDAGDLILKDSEENKTEELSVRTKNSNATSEVECTKRSSRNSSVSRASSLSSATGMSKISKHSASSIARKNNSFHPRPLPDEVAFEISISPLNAEATSPFRYDRRPPGDRKSLTSTNLTKSPRRFPKTSPARNTRSAEKKRLERVEAQNKLSESESTENDQATKQNLFGSPNRSATNPLDSPACHTRSSEKRRQEQQPEQNQNQTSESRMDTEDTDHSTSGVSSPRRPNTSDLGSVDSPARHTRSSEKRRQEQQPEQNQNQTSESRMDTEDTDHSTSGVSSPRRPNTGENAIKRKREDGDNFNNSITSNSNELSQTMEAKAGEMELVESVTVRLQKRRKSSAPALSSALRRGSAKKDATVRFGSPQTQTFNKKSPSMSVTPGRMGARFDDMATNEPSSDPSTELGAAFKKDAGSTPFKPRDVSGSPEAGEESSNPALLQPLSSIDSRMSIDSSSSSEDSDGSESEHNGDYTNEDDNGHTVPMDVDIESFLRSEEAAKKSPENITTEKEPSSTSSLQKHDEVEEEEETEDLTMDINKYLKGADGEIFEADTTLTTTMKSSEGSITEPTSTTNKSPTSSSPKKQSEEEDKTEKLPQNLSDFLNGAGSDTTLTTTKKKSSEGSFTEPASAANKNPEEEDNTEDFEMNMSDFLNGAGGESFSQNSDNNSSVRLSSHSSSRFSLGGRLSLSSNISESSMLEQTQLSEQHGLRTSTDGGESFLQGSVNTSSRRRSSLSSSRFSLAPDSRQSISSSCCSRSDRDLSQSSIMIDEQTQLSQLSGIHADESVEEMEEFDLNNREIVQVLQLEKATFNDQSDILCALTSDTIAEPSASLMMDCMMSACETLQAGVESGVAELKLDEVFEVADNRPPEVYLVLQQALRYGEHPDMQSKVQKMAGVVRRTEEEELGYWLVSVAEKLHEALRGEAEKMHQEVSKTENHLKSVNDDYETLTKMETKTARKARRKSLLRRKTNASKLEEEIAEIEASLAKAQSELETVTKENAVVNDLVTSVSQVKTLTDDLSTSATLASSSEDSYGIISGLGKWRPSLLQENNIQFTYSGPCKATCMTVAFNLATTGKVTCTAFVKPDLFLRESKRRPVKPAALFFEARVSALCEMVSSESLENPSQIGAMLRQLEWAVCRFEQTRSEISMLHRRYKARLVLETSMTKSPSIPLEVEFLSRSKKAKLLATFLVNKAYPFSSVDVQFDLLSGEVDMDGIQNFLIKNAKPGYGYLSRTCDMIAAFLR